MEKNNKILQELQECAPSLMQIDNKTPYRVALTYFDGLSGAITEKIKLNSDVKYYFSTDMPYSIPGDYFENFSSRVLEKIYEEEEVNEAFDELKEIAPLLNKISRKPVYSIPANYFEEKQWKKNIIADSRAKIISITAPKKIYRFLAAAVIIGLLAIGLFIFIGKDNTNARSYQVKAIPAVNKLSEQEIVEFLKTTSPNENIVSNKNIQRSKHNDIRSAVSRMSDEEIQEFLQENGEKDKM
ncbi:hypothetical protein [Segetibacter aerophilus]|uniref:Uncharacterized protein n=1 Tax=Segetibacter aerophilus TaxID=670293 RepID=A0A512BFC4_9BACT|nr:hypothetical protein [Segetibacter aerophilus]GEO10537.1 hypothetical protein SAE01_30330 [Segetibacter aerophilus]